MDKDKEMFLDPEAKIGLCGRTTRSNGRVKLPPISAPTKIHRDSNDHWSVEGRGDAYVLNFSDRWTIFAFGPRAAAISDIFKTVDKQWHEERGLLALSDRSSELNRELCRLTLPGCAIVALHSNGTVLLARDPGGFVPLYFRVSANELLFSTHLGSLTDQSEQPSLNIDKFGDMLLFGQRTGSRTVWHDVSVVQPGSFTLVSPQGLIQQSWFFTPETAFDIEMQSELASISEEEVLIRIGSTLDSSLDHLGEAGTINVPCGGGVDSSLLGAYLKEKGNDVVYWCINQPDAPKTEREWMEPMSKKLDIPCVYADLNQQNFVENLVETIARTGQPLTGPNAIGGVVARKLALEEGYEHYVSGEFCDTIFGGLSPNGRLWWPLRIIRQLSRLPYRLRMQLIRGLIGESAWFLDSVQVDTCDDAALVGLGHLHSAEKLAEIGRIEVAPDVRSRDMQLKSQKLAWIQMRDVASGLNQLFFEKDELLGGTTSYPFVHPEILELGLNLPFRYKVRSGIKKWLWRKFSSEYIGEEVAFRKKYGFPTLTGIWLESAGDLLSRGFLESVSGSDVSTIYRSLPKSHSARWTLVNIELWGRLCVWNDSAEELTDRLLRKS